MSARLAAVLIALGLLAGVWLYGRHVGALEVRAEWQAEKDADREAAEALREANRLRAMAASRDFEASRQRLVAQAEAARSALRRDLQVPVACSTGDAHALKLADLPIPAAAVGRLRDAAGQGAPAR